MDIEVYTVTVKKIKGKVLLTERNASKLNRVDVDTGLPKQSRKI